MKIFKLATLGLLLISINGCSNVKGQVILQPANTKAGYNFPYFLYIPDKMSTKEKLTLLVEPTNTGYVSDNFNDHIKKAKQMVTNKGYMGRYLSDSLCYPLLIPIFPRSKKEWQIYTHALDRDVILTTEESIKRIDMQLIAMMEDANSTLTKMGYQVQDKCIMTGFSACASFTNRFVTIHPDKIQLSVAGGLNGILILPIPEINGVPLKYPLGT